MQYKVTIQIREASNLGYWKNARKIFSATSISAAAVKAENNLFKMGLRKYSDYIILDVAKA